MLDSNFELDEPLEAILQRPLTWFEKQQIQDKRQASADEAVGMVETEADTHPLRRRLKDMAMMQVVRLDHPEARQPRGETVRQVKIA
ncbi:hypothetical protein A203_18530 [Chromobacterium violaceum]|uniref:hypothetical protein n=1 Tax=Chromobacterium violaceum TaxID=536 RepID=UPI000654A007|nr:hypothetical protein [Chromobacterium violaceum]KMN47196.1 hypothetical protein VK93_21920 [Chromobacterium violaceum]KMN84843.1 hypothetical protein VL02_18150 [Chromobacterium violaceum]KMN88207.1 hypothetical protein VL04_21725 [Chromobacterium violaceum]KMO02240.1 hypothetical protein VL16_20160 [Chromobacterium violaceum]